MDETRGDHRPSSAEEAWALLLKLQESGTAPDFEIANFYELREILHREFGLASG